MAVDHSHHSLFYFVSYLHMKTGLLSRLFSQIIQIIFSQADLCSIEGDVTEKGSTPTFTHLPEPFSFGGRRFYILDFQ